MKQLKGLLSFLLFLSVANTSAQQNTGSTSLPFSKSRTANNLVFISGQVGINPQTGRLVTTSFEEETHQVMKNVGTVLQEQGLSYNDLTFVTIYLKDLNYYGQVNKVYQTYFKGAFPARVCIAVADLPAHANIEITGVATASQTGAAEVVRQFLTEVRSGKHPEKARCFMADTIWAHQVVSEAPTTVKRTPQNYTDHVKMFLQLFGQFDFEITEFIGQGDKVYVRWKQTGKHLQEIDGYKPTGLPLVEYTSAVYRVENNRIVEYWIQMDRLGMEEQLKRNAKKKP